MRKEADLMKQVSQRLDIYKLCGQVEWWTRLNTGRIKTYYGSYVQLCNKGTPDFLALIREKSGKLCALFIETKADRGNMTKDQKVFFNQYTKKDIWMLCIKNIAELDYEIDQYAIDKLKEITL